MPYIFYLNAKNIHINIERMTNMHSKNGADIPLGLGMALMQNSDAFFYFSALDGKTQQQIIDGTKGIKTRQQMKNYVAGLVAHD